MGNKQNAHAAEQEHFKKLDQFLQLTTTTTSSLNTMVPYLIPEVLANFKLFFSTFKIKMDELFAKIEDPNANRDEDSDYHTDKIFAYFATMQKITVTCELLPTRTVSLEVHHLNFNYNQTIPSKTKERITSVEIYCNSGASFAIGQEHIEFKMQRAQFDLHQVCTDCVQSKHVGFLLHWFPQTKVMSSERSSSNFLYMPKSQTFHPYDLQFNLDTGAQVCRMQVQAAKDSAMFYPLPNALIRALDYSYLDNHERLLFWGSCLPKYSMIQLHSTFFSDEHALHVNLSPNSELLYSKLLAHCHILSYCKKPNFSSSFMLATVQNNILTLPQFVQLSSKFESNAIPFLKPSSDFHVNCLYDLISEQVLSVTCHFTPTTTFKLNIGTRSFSVLDQFQPPFSLVCTKNFAAVLQKRTIEYLLQSILQTHDYYNFYSSASSTTVYVDFELNLCTCVMLVRIVTLGQAVTPVDPATVTTWQAACKLPNRTLWRYALDFNSASRQVTWLDNPCKLNLPKQFANVTFEFG